jgi:MoxR-like ATPase
MSATSEKNADLINQVLIQAKKIIFGQDDLLESVLAALICEGHVLIEGMPGLGKTLSVSTMSKLCHISFKRIQFTPDLLPSDLVGTMIFNQVSQEFTTKFGPIFTQILLADEINRSPAKVQSALLEAMAERQVTIGDNTFRLKTPFVVLATQNPIEQEGTYQLPEAQLDRFMMKVSVDYPDFESEKRVLTLKHEYHQEFKPILGPDELIAIQQEVEQVYVDEKIKDFIVKIVHGSRPGNDLFPKEFEGMITAGASPRASIWLHKIAKFKAYREGKKFVTPDHVLSLVSKVLGHRIILSYEAQMDKIQAGEICHRLARKFL